MTIIRAARATSPRSRTECCTPIRLLDLNALTFPIGARVAVFMPPWHHPESIKARVIALRDEYERILVRLIDDLPLRSDIDKHYLRLTMIGALSWALFWFKKDRDDAPGVIAKQILSLLRSGFAPTQKPVNIR
jgi:hypothetical protein